jgi:hypothetical protein
LHLGILIPLLLIDEQAFGHFGFLIEQGIRIVHSEQQAFWTTSAFTGSSGCCSSSLVRRVHALEGWRWRGATASAGSDEGRRRVVDGSRRAAFCRAAKRFEVWMRWFNWPGDGGWMGRGRGTDPPMVLPAERRWGVLFGKLCYYKLDKSLTRKGKMPSKNPNTLVRHATTGQASRQSQLTSLELTSHPTPNLPIHLNSQSSSWITCVCVSSCCISSK